MLRDIFFSLRERFFFLRETFLCPAFLSIPSRTAKFLGRIVAFDASTSIPPSHSLYSGFHSSVLRSFSLKVLQRVWISKYGGLFWSSLLQHLKCLIACYACAVLDSEPCFRVPFLLLLEFSFGWLMKCQWALSFHTSPSFLLTLDNLSCFHSGFCWDLYTLITFHNLSSPFLIFASLSLYFFPDENSTVLLGSALVTAESLFQKPNFSPPSRNFSSSYVLGLSGVNSITMSLFIQDKELKSSLTCAST